MKKLLVLAAVAGMLAFNALSAHAGELIVSAAASLTNAFNEIGKAYETENPGTKVIFNFGASGALLQQIDKGAPVDVFASADQETMDKAQDKKIIVPATRKDFTVNKLVLIAPSGNPSGIKSLEDLKGPQVKRVAAGKPETVPVGRYTKESLLKSGMWDALEPKLIYADSVRQALDYVSRGEVDAGFVYATDAKVAGYKVKTITEVKGHKPVVYPIAVVSGTKDENAAGKFIDYVLAKKGQKILADFGFGKK